MGRKQKKTIWMFLMELPEDIAEKAYSYTTDKKRQEYPLEENTLPEALICAFEWAKTTEGYDYWVEIYNNLKTK